MGKSYGQVGDVQQHWEAALAMGGQRAEVLGNGNGQWLCAAAMSMSKSLDRKSNGVVDLHLSDYKQMSMCFCMFLLF